MSFFICLHAIQSRADDSPIATGAEQAVVFERDVRPILKAYCWHCHGEQPELGGKLDARLAGTLISGGESGPAIIAGKSADSLLMQKISSGEMPPGEKKLNLNQKRTLAQWIDLGAKTAVPEPASIPIGDVLTDDDRRHWSFQSVHRPEVPAVRATDRTRTAIDSFVLKRLEAQELSFGPDAERSTIVRRLWLDLVGMPPDAEELQWALSFPGDGWYEQLVDRLLASPSFGERWGRHWLDAVGYSDSNGYTEKDSGRPWMWKYRDYVIRAMNEDRPWDQFITEQLAGDEMVRPPYHGLDERDRDRLIATAFLRLVPDGTGDGPAEPDAARNDTIAETIKVVSSSMLGLTVGCAQCHAHRFDPISHADYYRLRAVFTPALNWKDWKRPQDRLISMWSDETKATADAVAAELATVQKEREVELDALVASTFEQELAKLPEEIRESAKTTRATPAKDRTPEQQELIKTYPFLNVDRGSVYLYLPDRLTGFNKKWDAKTKEVQAKRPADDFVFAVTEPASAPPPTFVFARGDYRQPKEEVQPTEFEVLKRPDLPAEFSKVAAGDSVSDLPSSGRRTAYARHLTSGRHPLTARVQVNRVWLHFFGRGIVATPGDFGFGGAKPSHPELLDWLASEFTDSGWDLKQLIRTLVTSTVYRQSSALRPELQARDPDNILLGRMPLRRLESEVVRDSVLKVSGRLSAKRSGEPIPVTPDDVGQIVIGKDNRDSAGRPEGKLADMGEEAVRRSIYAQARRSMPLSILEPFDHPVMTPNCELRAVSTVSTQALMLTNSQFIAESAQSLVEESKRHAGDQAIDRIRWVFRQATCRELNETETAAALEMLSGSELDEKESMARWRSLAQAALAGTRFIMVD
ncbi:MAG: PSD1 and planctomycete cytochrome C domain-containing protein [Pirellulales bacterium]